jgi:sec-independent protein translocase protein TatA
MGRFGVTEILILLGIALLFFGGSRIANIGKGLGEGIKNFKKGIKEGDGSGDESPKLPEGEAQTSSSRAEAPATAEKAEKTS